MHYAATINLMGREEVTVVLPLKAVPAFDPDNPPLNAYLVPECVRCGWIKQEDGSFSAPPEVIPEQSTEADESDETDQSDQSVTTMS